MKSIIGIGVGESRVCAVLVEDGRVKSRTRLPRVESELLSDTLSSALRELVPLATSRPEVVATIGPHAAQFKQLHGLSDGLSLEQADAVVRTSPDRFFRGDAARLLLTPVVRSDEKLWAGAFASDVTEAVRVAIEANRLRLRGCLPTVAVLGLVVPDGVFDWLDGGALVTAEYRGGRAFDAHISRTRQTSAAALDDHEYLDALAAARADSSPYLVDPGAARRIARRRRVVRVALASAVTLALAAATLVPLALSTLAARRASAELARLQPAIDRARGMVATELSALDAANAVENFNKGRRSTLALLAQLTAVLPDSSAIITLRSDERGIELVTLSTLGATLADRIAMASLLTQPRLLGAITTEEVGGRQLHRVGFSARHASPEATDAP